MRTVRLVVISDTHLRGGVAGRLPRPLLEAIEGCDLLLHAGDVTSRQALDELARLAPLRAVLGNNDGELVGVLAEELRFELEGVRVAMLHDSGERTRREARMALRFPEDDVVIFGHSHVPEQRYGSNGQLLFNPGSPTQRRSQPHATFGLLEVGDGAVLGQSIVEL